MSGSDPERDKDRGIVARRWLTIARTDVRAVEVCLADADPLMGIAAFHCQQAAEKLLKGLLVLGDMPFSKTHDIGKLYDLAGSRYPDRRAAIATLVPLTDWAVVYRYPGDYEFVEPSLDDLRTALRAIEDLASYLHVQADSEPST